MAVSTSSVRVTRAVSVARFTSASAPGTWLSFFSTRATHEAQVIPPIVRSIVPIGSGWSVSVPVVRGASVMSSLRSGDAGVAGLVYGGAVVVVGQGGVGGDGDGGERAGVQAHDDVGDSRERGELPGDGRDAVAAGHAVDLDGGVHGGVLPMSGAVDGWWAVARGGRWRVAAALPR